MRSMANFKTHLGVAAVGSGLLATVCLGAGMSSPQEVVTLSVVGTVGGLLPDIDLDHSSPTKLIFTALAIVFAFLAAFNRVASYSIVELWIVWGVAYGGVRYLALSVFSALTVHRGIFHSLVAALFFWFLATSLSYYLFALSALFAWSIGFFLFFGYIVHLLLDELFSVDLLNSRLKSSFGTALKIADFHNARTSLLMTAAALLMFFSTPSAQPFLDWVTNKQTYLNIADRFLPEALWFVL